jgi:hypothetical protein
LGLQNYNSYNLHHNLVMGQMGLCLAKLKNCCFRHCCGHHFRPKLGLNKDLIFRYSTMSCNIHDLCGSFGHRMITRELESFNYIIFLSETGELFFHFGFPSHIPMAHGNCYLSIICLFGREKERCQDRGA